MIQKRILRACSLVALPFLLSLCFQLAWAHAVSCDNSKADSVVPVNEKGEPLMPNEIQNNAEKMKELKALRALDKENIQACFKSDKPLANHVIDFDLYVETWKEIEGQKPTLRIQNSVLWSFKKKEVVSLEEFARDIKEGDGRVTQIRWRDVTLGPSFSAIEVRFPPGTSFDSSRFPTKADFYKATFDSETSFKSATFDDGVRFMSAMFSNAASFKSATFGDGASFRDARFGDRASFEGANFGDGTSFRDARFGDQSSFEGANFSGKTLFRGAAFDNTSFRGAVFGGNMSLQSVIVRGTINLVDTNWAGRANFRESTIQYLSWNSDDSPSNVTGIFEARDAQFEGVEIRNVHFFELVDLSYTEFGKIRPVSSELVNSFDAATRKGRNVLFENVLFEKEVSFLRAKFWGNAVFVENYFRGVWNLTDVTFRKEKKEEEQTYLCLSFNRVGNLIIAGELLGYEGLLSPTSLKKSRIRSVISHRGARTCEYTDLVGLYDSHNVNEQLSAIYKTIGLSFRKANNRRGENEAWYLGQIAERKSQDGNKMIHYMSWIFLDLPSRHGIDLYRVVLTSAVLMTLFAGIYWAYLYRQININKWKALVRLKPFPDQKRAFRFRPVEQFFENEDKQDMRLLYPLDALFLSGRAFFKLGLGAAYPRKRGLMWIAYIEWTVGMYMLIHFLFAVRNTLPIALPFLTGSG